MKIIMVVVEPDTYNNTEVGYSESAYRYRLKKKKQSHSFIAHKFKKKLDIFRSLCVVQ